MAFRNLPEMPCGPILELHGQRKRFHVPYGLKRLIEDMTREVLRYQPENIYEFLAGFMDSRLQKKLTEEANQQRRKSWEQHRWSWQGHSILEPEELKEFLEELHAPEEAANHHAVVIQSAFRGYQARKKVKNIRKSEDAKRKSQLVKLQSQGEEEEDDDEEEEQQRKKSWQQHRWSWEGKSVLEPEELKEFLDELHAPEEAANHHAVVIQSAFRGYQARKKVKNIRKSQEPQRKSQSIQPPLQTEEEEDEDLFHEVEEDEEEEAY